MKVLIDAGTKVCRKCKVEKPLSNFHPHKGCSQGVRGSCRDCVRDRINGWYADNRKRRQEAANLSKRALKLKAVEYMGGKCQDCGGVFHQCVMQFHHLEPHTKDGNPSRFFTSWERAKSELDKCVMLCANCHMIRHHVEQDDEVLVKEVQ